MKKLSPRAKFIATVDLKKLAGYAWDAMQLASTHDPDHDKTLKDHARWLVQLGTQLSDRLDVIERQLQRLGAPQYRRVRKGVYAERVRGEKAKPE